MNLTFTNVGQVIQLAVAPVFLLTSVGTILAVLSGRLARIIDRARVLAERLEKDSEAKFHPVIRDEMKILIRRRHFVNMAITAGVATAILVCVLISLAFIGTLLQFHVSVALAVIFIAAMFSFMAALLFFLREVLLTVLSYRIDVR
ncbi:MAG: DUF2721 domain-containing protein [Myxococcaceae bacterium]